MTTKTCFRCDWAGEVEAETCPSCGTPFYRPAPAVPAPAPPEPPPLVVAGSRSEPVVHPTEGRAAGTSPLAALSIVGAVALVMVFLLGRGGPAKEDERVAPPRPTSPPVTGGQLVYAVPTRDGMARLWRWDLGTDRVARGPLVDEPLALVNVASPGYGWLGVTSDSGDGLREASILGSLDARAKARPLGQGDLVTWAKQGQIVVLVDRGPAGAGCRRTVDVTSVDIRGPTEERIYHDELCGEILSVGRTSIGYFMTVLGEDGTDVVGFGYPDPGILLHDYGVIDVAPGGDLLVTPAEEFATDGGSGATSPPTVAGEASRFRLFGGPPVDLLADAAPLAIERVLAYAAGGTRALVVGHQGVDADAVWELPLGFAGSEPAIPRYVLQARGVTTAAYANDGTAFLLTGGRLFHLRDGRLSAAPLPEGAPAPDGALAWIVREPLTQI